MTADGAPARELAPAKVNLFLHVRGRRPDGYHVLDSLAVFPRVGDLLEAEPAEGLSLSLDGPFAIGLDGGGDNLVIAAARALSERVGAEGRARPGAALRLTKTLPVAAGVGGGSADAGAALRLLARLWPGTPEEALPGLAASLGADAPVCLAGRPALMGGVGELLSPAPAFAPFWMVLVNPMQPLSTAEVFGALERRANPETARPPLRFVDFDHMASWLSIQRNDLEAPARALRPAIGRVLSALAWDRRCRLARMSGSGATCFGLYEREADALAAADRLRAAEGGWWIAAAPVEEWSP
ncbi:MAG: 4-(cytidine 5'-diphospho)-2-C-methyl-D-erythritol kinase [Pseudomonadota bacterium]